MYLLVLVASINTIFFCWVMYYLAYLCDYLLILRLVSLSFILHQKYYSHNHATNRIHKSFFIFILSLVTISSWIFLVPPTRQCRSLWWRWRWWWQARKLKLVVSDLGCQFISFYACDYSYFGGIDSYIIDSFFSSYPFSLFWNVTENNGSHGVSKQLYRSRGETKHRPWQT